MIQLIILHDDLVHFFIILTTGPDLDNTILTKKTQPDLNIHLSSGVSIENLRTLNTVIKD